MIAVMRTKFGPIVIGGIIGLIAFVFIFYGVFMPGGGGGGGMGGGSGTAGEVNGEVITFAEYSRELAQRTEFIKSMMGGKISEEQIEKFGVRDQVFNDIARRKLLAQMAKDQGFYPSNEEVRDQIVGMEYFKKDGRFDRMQYKNVLAQNNYTVARFEDSIAQEIAAKKFKDFITSLAVTGPDAVTAELKKTKEKRKLKFVYLDHESVRKTLPKDLKPEEMNKKVDEAIEKASAAVMPLLKSGNDKQIDAVLKPYGIKVKTSEWLTSQAGFIAGVGSIQSAQQEVFAMKKGDAAKKFTLLGGTLMASIADAEYYDPAKTTAKDRAEVQTRLQNQRENEIISSLTEFWVKKAKISKNPQIVTTADKQPRL